jgi:non-specific serine/threonine protein kinase
VQPEQWASVESLFAILMELPPEEREIRLREVADERIRAEVESLLRHAGEGRTVSEVIGAFAARVDVIGHQIVELQPGQLIGGKYRLARRLGEGGMGVVFQAFDEILQRNVALKFLTSVRFSGQLLSEARAASALNHPNIVTIHDFGSDHGTDFIVMEFVEGDTLRDAISRGPLRPDLLGEIALKAASVLEVTHRAGIVHGDIKPANILLTAAGQIKLADFGIARRLRAASDATATQPWMLAGTFSYMSPEQARGMPLDGRSDIYSLGVVLYEAACAQRASGGVSAIRELRPDLPSAWAEILQKAMAQDPRDRFQTAGDLSAALSRMHQNPPELQGPAPHLPARMNRLIGRERELEEVETLLSRDDVRLLNLTGPGGIGKTRLAVEVCHQMAGRFEGVWFVGLESAREAGAIGPAILHGLGLREADARPPRARLMEYFGQRSMLLVLDNFEQIAEGAGYVGELLNDCPRLRVLVTSRALLRLRVEREYAVPPLAFSGADAREDLLQRPGIALFLDRSHAKEPSLETLQEIARICARVDGIPLAIELAAARTRVLAPKSILNRLSNRFQLLRGGARDLPQRHQALRNTIDWSYDLLEPAEQLMLRRLSVFEAGATTEAAEAVCCGAGDDVVELLTSLADKSLLRQIEDLNVPSRIQMMETVREYAREKLQDSGEARDIQSRHAVYYSRMAEAGDGQGHSGSPGEYYDSLEREQANCRAALDYFLVEQPAAALQMAIALWPFWEARGFWTRGRNELDRALKATSESCPPALRAKGLYAAGVLADAQGDYSAARIAFDEHLALQRAAFARGGDPGNVAAAINNLGIVALRQGDFDAARAAYEEALVILRSLGSKRAVAQCLNNLGHVALGRGDSAAARGHYQESLAICREIQSPSDLAWTLSNLADVARQESQTDDARSLYAQSFALFRDAQDQPGMASCMADLGNLSVVNHNYREGAQFYQESLVIFGDLGDLRGMLRVLEGFAGLASAQARHKDALRLVGTTGALYRVLGVRHTAWQRMRRDGWIATARAAMENDVDALIAEGERRPLEKAIEGALSGAALCYSDS